MVIIIWHAQKYVYESKINKAAAVEKRTIFSTKLLPAKLFSAELPCSGHFGQLWMDDLLTGEGD